MSVGVNRETIAIPTAAERLKVEATKLEEAIKTALGSLLVRQVSLSMMSGGTLKRHMTQVEM